MNYIFIAQNNGWNIMTPSVLRLVSLALPVKFCRPSGLDLHFTMKALEEYTASPPTRERFAKNLRGTIIKKNAFY